MKPPYPVSAAEAEIRYRIGQRGPITFAEFMDLALYWPRGGYYARDYARNYARDYARDYAQDGDHARGEGHAETSPFGRSGDYYTSPMAHPAFGSLLALQLYQFWLLLDRPNPFDVAEPGSGNGQLGRDILSAAAGLPGGFAHSLRYICLDRSPGDLPRKDSPGDPVAPPLSQVKTDTVPLRNLRGCIISNELIDAFPVHQVTMRQGKLREVYIGVEVGGVGTPALVELADEPSDPGLAARLDGLGIGLAEGQVAEINLGLDGWADSVAGALDAGFVLTIDYGQEAKDLYSPELRPRGTLTTYYRHVQTDAPLRNIGRQDITAQVDFTSLDLAGQAAGLTRLGCVYQREFLLNLGLDALRRRVTSTRLPASQGVANRAGLAALSNPRGLGRFRTLIQAKGLPSGPVAGKALWGLGASPECLVLNRSLPTPLLGDRHISLPEGWPQAGSAEFVLKDLWDGPFPLP